MQSDLDRAEKSLTDTVLNQAMKSLAGEVGSTTNLEVVYVVKVVDRKFMVRPGDVAENFLASIKLDVTAVYYGKEDMQTWFDPVSASVSRPAENSYRSIAAPLPTRSSHPILRRKSPPSAFPPTLPIA
jgi:hypothetical protein